MDSGSSNFKIDEQDPELVLGRGLGRAKGVLIDAGLHSMYVHSIRRAKHFIHIENQFFTGVKNTQILMLICQFATKMLRTSLPAEPTLAPQAPSPGSSIFTNFLLLYICSMGWQAVFAST